MAQPLKCDSGDDQPAALVVTDPTSGQVNAWCGTCVLVWMRATLEAVGMRVLDGPAAEPTAAAEAAGEGEAAPDPPRPKRGRTRRQAGPEDLSAAQSPFSDATPVDE